jgi:DNA-binding NtrC family response regulator
MRESITLEFGDQRPRAIVLDDNANARRSTSRRLEREGFEVIECASADQFFKEWIPGTVDVIVSDWELSNKEEEGGDQVLASVRERDWDVPFVLISGKLDQASQRAEILENLLDSGNARFVERGDGAIQKACEAAEELIERRDLALLKVILALRPAALRSLSVPTSSGQVTARDQLAELVSQPTRSHEAGRPLAAARSKRALEAE